MVIVIDGPAGAGKSSTAKAVAKKLGIEYLDSGALYRALTYMYLEAGSNSEAFFKILNGIEVSFKYELKKEIFRVYIEDKDITGKLRTTDIADNVSTVASMPRVRSYVNRLMRKVVKRGNYIAEGRDLGTVVFPDADLKFYMHADVSERARRRYEELIASGNEISLKEVKQNILERDNKDSRRDADPLTKADDAIEINTTDLNFEQQVDQICSTIVDQLELTIKQ